MMKENYLNLVKQADNVEVINGLHHDAMNDPSLHSTDKDEISTAVQNKFAAINAVDFTGGHGESGAPKRMEHRRRRMTIFSRKVLPLLFFIFCLVPPRANSQVIDAGLFSRRLAALSMIESGDDDNAIGKAGEVSRFQIMPSMWHAYAGYAAGTVARYKLKVTSLDPRNPFTARNVATMILHDRCQAFEARFHREPTDLEFYLLWNSPRALDGAERFSNLVNSHHQL